MKTHLIGKNWGDELATLAKDARSLRIICPFIKTGGLEYLRIESFENIRVITRRNEHDFYNGVSDIAALRQLLEVGAEIRGVKELHSKVYLFSESHAVITSANLTQSAMTSNHECGVVSTDGQIITECCEYFNDLWKKAGDNLAPEDLENSYKAVNRAKTETGEPRKPANLKDWGVKIGGISAPSVQAPAISERAEAPWTGNFYYVSVKNIPTHRSWNDMREYGFVAAGESRKSSRQLDRLTAGDAVYAYLPPGIGYVGFGIVTASSVMARDFKLADSRSLTEIKSELENDNLLNAERLDNKEKCEYLVAVEWKNAVAEEEARPPPKPNHIRSVVCKLDPSRAHYAEILNFLAREFGAPGS